MTQVIKKVGIAVMVAVFVVALCLSMLPLKAYADSVPYVVGDTGPAGGLIFYVDGSYCLEAAPSDQSLSIAWITGGSTQTTLCPGTFSSAIGTGQANTNLMMGQSGYNGGAAKVCDDYSLNGYSDWFLPSFLEIDQMETKLCFGGNIGGFVINGLYWCSTQVDASNALMRQFGIGSSPSTLKSYGGYVRAIRAFSGMKETGSSASGSVEKPWVRTQEMTCKQVWINEDNKFQFSFIYPYRDNNWVKIYDMSGKEVYSIDMPYDNPNIIVDLPDGMYTVKTFTVGRTEPIQTFVIGKP